MAEIKAYFKVEEAFFDNWIVATDAAMGYPKPGTTTYTWKKRHPTDTNETKVIGTVKTGCDAGCEQAMRDEMFNLYGSQDFLTYSALYAEGWFPDPEI